MEFKWIGAVLILIGCGGFGVTLGAGYKKQVRILSGILNAIQIMENELEYRLTQLPELLLIAGEEADANVKQVFQQLSESLERNMSTDPKSGMADILSASTIPYPYIRRLLMELGNSLGKYDLAGQLRGLAYIKKDCMARLEALKCCQTERMKSYQTLSICAGVAFIIIFM